MNIVNVISIDCLKYSTKQPKWQHSKECKCRLRNKACDCIEKHDNQRSVITGQTDARLSDPYVPLGFAHDTKRNFRKDACSWVVGTRTGCFINSVTILNLYIIKISTLNCLTSKYYENIMICILFGIKIDPYLHNLGLLYENLKTEQFLWCVQNDVTVRVSKTEGPIIPTELQAAHIAYDFLSILSLFYETM